MALIAVLAWGFLSQGVDEVPITNNEAVVVQSSFSASYSVSSRAQEDLLGASNQNVGASPLPKLEVTSVSSMVKVEVLGGMEPIVASSAGALLSIKTEPLVRNITSPRSAIKPQPAPMAKAAKSVGIARAKPAIEGLTPDESALMAMATSGYVLQVSAAKSLPALEEFVRIQSNRVSLRIYRSLRSGKSWFVVVEGFYADKDSALAAMSNLPSGQLKAGPWPKSMAAVRLEIAAYKQQTP